MITNFNECYTFTLNDSFGDGNCCAYGLGTLRLEDGSGAVLFNGDGNFGATTSHLFLVNQSLNLNNNELVDTLKIYPNPSSNIFNINTGDLSKLSYDIINIIGQSLQKGEFNTGINSISLKNEDDGLYFIRIINTESNVSLTKKLIKN
ncbi:T9SS type A sorting domain-containing protein [Lacinutrix jangbogonensis]|uniref:T9SS type A sorting domain-containing protein n=1 Tax=Lacinutrix jangbogonensis TaxID=1469557 RepID=UPI00053E50E8|nr:T9SS type A sorting domain-containing protein [Lacinutrix jangbogonensis]